MFNKIKIGLIKCVRWVLDKVAFLRPLLYGLMPEWLHVYLTERLMSGRPERIYLQDTILPRLAEQKELRVLFVGCKSYTRKYGLAFEHGSSEFWTTDIDADSVRWGEAGRHILCDIKEIDDHAGDTKFDVVVMNGIFGFGVDSDSDKDAASRAVHRILETGGTLVLGWSLHPPDQDPDRVGAIRELFSRGTRLAFESEVQLEGTDHRFSFLEAK